MADQATAVLVNESWWPSHRSRRRRARRAEAWIASPPCATKTMASSPSNNHNQRVGVSSRLVPGGSAAPFRGPFWLGWLVVAMALLFSSPVRAFTFSLSPAPPLPLIGARKPVLPRGGQLDMIGSIFKWGANGDDSEEFVEVNIESPSANVRRISSSIVIDRPPATVWRILTDYDNLANYVPNLVESKVIPRPPGAEKVKGVRLYQEGAQRIIGFNFRASLTMDMEEVFEKEQDFRGIRRIKFKLIESAAFNDFSGEWRLQCYGRARQDGTNEYYYTTRLFYMVTVKPKGPVPVAAIEWRIREDVPTNLRAVKIAAEKLPVDYSVDDGPPLTAMTLTNDKPVTAWQSDETLQAYISPPVEEPVVVAPKPSSSSSSKKASGSSSSSSASSSSPRALFSRF